MPPFESVERTLGRIEGKLDAALKDKDKLALRLDDVDVRLDKVEKWQISLTAAGGAMLLLIGIAYKVLLGLHMLTN